MQIDFHFHAIYLLARCAGFAPEHAFKVAYSSQHTDDAIYEHALEFQNGGRFQQVLSAHRLFDPNAISKQTCHRIWVPFHFLPGNSGVDFYQRMQTRPGGAVMQRVLDDLAASRRRPYLLHRLGITLHVCADTWSHQNFLGLMHGTLNDVKRLKVEGETGESLRSSLKRIKSELVEYLAPKLGHAQAGTIPDEPFREWRYQDGTGRPFPEISNVMRAMDAAQACYLFLQRFLSSFPEFSAGPPLLWHSMMHQLRDLFETKGPLPKRCDAWQAAIVAGVPGFRPLAGDKNLKYGDRKWFKEAIEVKSPGNQGGPEQYVRKPGFETSDWKYFHDAAAFHRFTVLHEALPECGMICG